MTAIHAVLLRPHRGDPHNLLARGPCGASPPVACHVSCFEERHWGWRAVDDTSPAPTCECPAVSEDGLNKVNEVRFMHPDDDTRAALVLAWDGEALAEGLLPLWRASLLLGAAGITDGGILPRRPTLFQAEQWGRRAAAAGYGTLVELAKP